MNSTICEARILVRGKPVTEFFHEGSTFMEGRGGSEFEISVRNKSSKRVMVVISVDGVSVINGGVAGPDSPGYTIGPFQSILIPGWKLTTNSAAKFTFGSRAASYAQSATGAATNCGVIGVMVWDEKVVNSYDYQTTYTKSVMRGATGSIYDNKAASAGGASSSLGSLYASTTANTTSVNTARATSVNNLGTGFGESTMFNTTSTTFNKDSVVDTLVMYYDDARGLKSRGIVLERPIQVRTNSVPDPFPAMGCTPPKGWVG